MGKIKFSLLFLFMLLFTACSQQNNNYVKNIYINKNDTIYEMSVIYYDFESRDENYKKSEYYTENIYNLGIKAMEDGNYNFRLCENIFISPRVFSEDIGKVVYVINSLKISPNSNIVCFAGIPPEKDLTPSPLLENPIHSLQFSGSEVTGCFPIATGDGKPHGSILVKNNYPIKTIDKNTLFVLGILTNSIKRSEYTFRNNEMWAKISGRHTNFYIRDNSLFINVDLTLKEYKGELSSIRNKSTFKHLLAADISNRINEIYDDIRITEYFNLYWYCKQQGIMCDETSVKVNIM